ncbi:MAG: helix-turn-helix transcriptional regulator [Parvularculaceae bacterium]|nr:helix-turn-helix transcriptional regulator [Parvularculaceae bacterium]
MPSRVQIAHDLAAILKVLAHPDRVRIIEELRNEEHDVNDLHERLDLPAARVSQHLALLRAHRLVEERREGRHHYYQLVNRDVADWLIDGLNLLDQRAAHDASAHRLIDAAKKLWAAENPPGPLADKH